jgi:uncharacterized metal-binding protein
MAKDSCCSGGAKMILACSGGSNVGQLTNDVARELDVAGEGRFFCLAGVGGHIGGILDAIKGAGKVVVLDGCSVACARKALDAAGIAGYEYLVVTDLGIEKKHEFNLAAADMARTRDAARAKLG